MDSFGKIAFEAYKEKKQGVTYDDKQIPAWEDLSDDVRGAWEAAAEAVATQAGIRESLITLKKLFTVQSDEGTGL